MRGEWVLRKDDTSALIVIEIRGVGAELREGMSMAPLTEERTSAGRPNKGTLVTTTAEILSAASLTSPIIQYDLSLGGA